jgi:hypothetical protein
MMPQPWEENATLEERVRILALRGVPFEDIKDLFTLSVEEIDTLAPVIVQAHAEYRVNLKQAQYIAAMGGSVFMQRFLGIVDLKQRDRGAPRASDGAPGGSVDDDLDGLLEPQVVVLPDNGRIDLDGNGASSGR